MLHLQNKWEQVLLDFILRDLTFKFLDADVSEETIDYFSTVAGHSPPWDFQNSHIFITS